MLIVYLAGVITALYYVLKILGPEMAKPAPSKIDAAPSEIEPIDGPENRIEKLERLLAEKNKNISLLQNELKVFHAQVRHFDKIKVLQEEEIHRLKEQNRIFRSELGIPAIAPSVESKEKSIT